MKVKEVENFDEGWQVFVDMHMCAKIGASRSSRFLADHTRKFRDRSTYAVLSASITPFNSVGTVTKQHFFIGGGGTWLRANRSFMMSFIIITCR